MAKSKTADSERPTVRAVVKYAQQLREQAAKARAADPNVELYAPSDDVARKYCSTCSLEYGKELGPQKALEKLARLAFECEQEYVEADDRARDARRMHLIHQSIGAGEREALRSRMTLGQRLDVALLGWGVVSEMPAARLDGDVITGSGGGRGDHLARLVDTPVRRRRDGHGVWDRDQVAAEARRLVERAERELDQARRLLVEGVQAA